MESCRQSVKQITKKSTKDRKTTKGKNPPKKAKSELQKTEETAALGACILQMFCTLETQTMNKVRQDLARFRVLLGDAVKDKTESDTPCHMEKLPEAITQAWSIFKVGEYIKAQKVFINIISSPPVVPLTELFKKMVEEDMESKGLPVSKLDSIVPETPPPEIQDVQYDSGIEVDMIDSPSLYKLPNEDYLTEVVQIKEEAIPSTSHSPNSS